jgi:hypothetical protein
MLALDRRRLHLDLRLLISSSPLFPYEANRCTGVLSDVPHPNRAAPRGYGMRGTEVAQPAHATFLRISRFCARVREGSLSV